MSHQRNPARHITRMLKRHYTLCGNGYFHNFPISRADIIHHNNYGTYYIKVYAQWFLIKKVYNVFITVDKLNYEAINS